MDSMYNCYNRCFVVFANVKCVFVCFGSIIIIVIFYLRECKRSHIHSRSVGRSLKWGRQAGRQALGSRLSAFVQKPLFCAHKQFAI